MCYQIRPIFVPIVFYRMCPDEKLLYEVQPTTVLGKSQLCLRNFLKLFAI